MLSTRLKQLRTDKRINQIQLATEMGVTQGTVGKWETDKRVPDSQMLCRLAAFFDVTVDYLLGSDSAIVLLTRKLSGLPDTDKNELISELSETIDVYLRNRQNGENN
ncbi:MAG: helix-turn-helix domain-containing protein [Oscillospiraceae bacterium]|nr:helix-turn-helix domain-containing protein [Oscillospiraceae bacterium]